MPSETLTRGGSARISGSGVTLLSTLHLLWTRPFLSAACGNGASSRPACRTTWSTGRSRTPRCSIPSHSSQGFSESCTSHSHYSGARRIATTPSCSKTVPTAAASSTTTPSLSARAARTWRATPTRWSPKRRTSSSTPGTCWRSSQSSTARSITARSHRLRASGSAKG